MKPSELSDPRSTCSGGIEGGFALERVLFLGEAEGFLGCLVIEGKWFDRSFGEAFSR